MKVELSKRVQAVKPSATVAISSKAMLLKRAGEDIISLSVGEPDSDTADFVKEAAKQAIDDGKTKYTPVDGLPELKEAVIQKFKNENHVDYELNQILVSSGAKQSLYNLFQALLNEGDEVVILAPFWVSYPEMAKLADGTPVIVTPEAGSLKVTAAQIDAAMTDKTKLVLLNSPSNPSGQVFSAEELRNIAAVLKKYPQAWIASDDIYEHIQWTGNNPVNIVNVCPELYDRTILINGVSKAYAMTGWRIGYAAGHPDLIKAMKTIQSQSTTAAATMCQIAATTALTGDQSRIAEMRDAFKIRHDWLLNRINQIDGLSLEPGEGAFYAFVNAQAAVEKLGLADDVALADFLLDNAKVATVPGTPFGMPGYIRLSYATSQDNLEKACDRIEQAIA